jgi:Domain of unknown function (DUF6531)
MPQILSSKGNMFKGTSKGGWMLARVGDVYRFFFPSRRADRAATGARPCTRFGVLAWVGRFGVLTWLGLAALGLAREAKAQDYLQPPSAATPATWAYQVGPATAASCAAACQLNGWTWTGTACEITVNNYAGCTALVLPCPAGYRNNTVSGPPCVAITPRSVPLGTDLGKQLGEPRACVGDPCDPATGNKYLADADYVGSGPFPLRFVRYYNALDFDSNQQAAGIRNRLGPAWHSSYERRVDSFSDDTAS